MTIVKQKNSLRLDTKTYDEIDIFNEIQEDVQLLAALGHEYKNSVCTKCGLKQQSDFVNLKDFYWKYGEFVPKLSVSSFFQAAISESKTQSFVDP